MKNLNESKKSEDEILDNKEAKILEETLDQLEK